MNKIKTYLPDIITQFGILILAYNTLPICSTNLFGETCGGYGRVWGVVFITIGLNIAVRRYISHKK